MIKKLSVIFCLALLSACTLLQSPTGAPPATIAPPTTEAGPAATAVSTIPPAEPGQVSGRVCYPSEFIPAMTAYFLETGSQTYTELAVAENQSEYTIELPAGSYQVFAWVGDFEIGGGYTAYVACGYGEDCTDHSLQEVAVEAGQSVTGVDICDWVLTDLPLPNQSGGEAPESAAGMLAGLVYRTPQGLWRIDSSGEHVLLFDRPDAIVLSQETFVYTEVDDIWLHDAAAGQSTNLTNTPDRIEALWSGVTQPEGALLFTSFPVDFELGPGVTGFLTIVALDGSGYRVLDDENQTWHFEVSPNGAQVAYGLGRTGLILDLASGERSEFAPADYGLDEVASIGSPAWSPDGSRISWVVGVQPEEEGQPFFFGLAVFDLSAGTAGYLHLHELPGMDGYPPPAVWRPDGRWLIYNAFDVDFSLSGLWLLQPEDQTGVYLGQGGGPVWRPDGGGLVYLDSSTGLVRYFDPISLETTVLDFSDKNTQPVAWLP